MAKIKLTISEIEEIFRNFEDKKILIIGDAMLDSYWWGDVNRISPEAPVPIVKVKKRKVRLGGAANVALNIKALGATPILTTVIGNDPEGVEFLKLLDEESISKEYIVKSGTRPTTVKSRIIANNQQQLVRLDREVDTNINSEIKQKLKEHVFALLADIHAIIFQDYDKGVLTHELIQDIIQEANVKDIPTIIDPKKRNFKSYKNATLFKPNTRELRDGLGLELVRPFTKKKLSKAADVLFRDMEINIALFTLSEEGVYINDRKNEFLVSSHKRSIYDVSGAGDTVASVAALALACQLQHRLLAELTNISGGLVCEEVGVVPIEREKFFKECVRILS